MEVKSDYRAIVVLDKATDFLGDMMDLINKTRKSQFRVLDLHLVSEDTE